MLKYFISGIIVSVMPLIFTKIILNCDLKKNKKKIVVATFISIICCILAFKYVSGIYKTVFSFIIYVFIIYNFYQISLNKAIVITIAFILLLIVPEGTIMLTLIYIFNLSKEFIYTSFAGSLTANISTFLFVTLLTLLLRKPIRFLIRKDININFRMVMFSILSLLSILMFFYDFLFNYRVGARIIFYIIAIITFVLSFILVILQENHSYKQKLEYRTLLKFMEKYEVELEGQRVDKHEHKNNLITIKSKIIDGDTNENTIAYIDSLLGDEKKFVHEKYVKFQYLPPNGLKALFYFKVSEAELKGIDIDVNISQNIKNSSISTLTTNEFKNLGILIGVYIDNAIDAAKNCDKKLIGIEMYENSIGTSIIISNTFNGEIDTNKIGKMNYSTKGKGRGYGLLLANNIVKRSLKIKTETEITDGLYIQSIIIKNNK